MFSSRNKYDIFIILLISCLAFGQVGGYLQIVRALTIILAPFLFGKVASNESLKPYVTGFTLLCLYATASLYWTTNMSEGVKHLIYLFVHLLGLLEIVVFSQYALTPIRSISSGWQIAVCLTLIVAFWELTTDNHLSYSKFEEARESHAASGVFLRHFAAVTFYNPNTYVTFLCFALPYLFYRLYDPQNGRMLYIIMNVFIILMATVCILYNASRGGFIVLLVMFAIFAISFLKGSSSRYITILFFTFLLLIIYRYSYVILFTLTARVNDGIVYENEGRFVIWQNCWRAFTPTLGLGVGIGGIAVAMKAVSQGILVPHNIFIEVLMEYGLLFFIAFVVFYLRKIRQAYKKPTPSIKYPLLMALVTFPIYGIINSVYLTSAYVFLGLASMIVFSNNIENEDFEFDD